MNKFYLGDLEILRIEEAVERDADPEFLYPALNRSTITENLGWLTPHFYNAITDRLQIHIQSWLIRTKHHTILIDTCGGNHKPRPWFPFFDQANTPYLERLKAAGCAPEDIDFVFCTHLHLDHCGWNTRLENGRWVPTFPNAQYLFSRTEYESWNVPGAERPPHYEIFEDSVLPVIQAGLGRIVEDNFHVTDQISIEAAPGHTVGHGIIRATSQLQSGIFTGDAFHHPLQILDPALSSSFCVNPVQGEATRRRLLADCADHGHLMIPAHFGPPHVGRIKRARDGFMFHPGL